MCPGEGVEGGGETLVVMVLVCGVGKNGEEGEDEEKARRRDAERRETGEDVSRGVWLCWREEAVVVIILVWE